MKPRPLASMSALGAILLGVIVSLSFSSSASGGKNTPPPTPTPTPVPTPTPTPVPTATPAPSATPSPTPVPNTSKAASPDTTIDNRFVTMAIQLGDGRSKASVDVYSNVLVHANARIATAQGFYTASQRGSSGMIQNPTPAPTPVVDPSAVLRDDPPPKTAVDWGWSGNKKPKKVKK